ncbi:LemA family protein [Rhodococcus spelaei]|uniref:LemA family protein n=1 Tax=Rhodococcus spelaei TaxID=2546320 RepID=UPI0015EEB61E|nr:LemA family protein [Rhodococcus spelaei]
MAVVAVVLFARVYAVVRRLRRTEANLTASRSLLEVELGRRYEQVNDLVVAARAANMDSSVLAPLAGARSLALGFREQGMTLGDQAGSENALSVALHRVVLETGSDPKVKNDWAIQRPVLELQRTEQRLVGAARVYNSSAAAMNSLSRGIGTAPVARVFGGRPAPMFEATLAELPVELPAELRGEELTDGEVVGSATV